MDARSATHGRRWAETDVAGVPVARVEHEPGSVMPEHAHEQASLSLVVAGGFEETLGGRKRRYASSTIIYKPAHSPHSTIVGTERTLTLNLAPSPELVQRLGLQRPRVARGGPVAVTLLQLVVALNATDVPAAAHCLEACLDHLRATPPADDGSETTSIRRLLADGMTVEETASRLGLHPATVRRRLARDEGVAPSVWRRRVMVGRAAALLADSETPIAAVAAECGFSDQAHLTHSLRRETGLTPLGLRRTARSFTAS